MRGEELGDFLRSRRERLTPESVGLPATAGRRAAGLRREEVAVLAGVGVSWLTRLEQGRANRVSAEVLEGIAGALRLSGPERTHLFTLAGVRAPAPNVGLGPASAAHHRLVDGLHPNPAYVLDPAWNLACWNAAESALFPVLQSSPSDANLLRLLLETPELRRFMSDWAAEINRLTREFRLHVSQFPNEHALDLANDLRADHPEFAEAWERHDVAVFSPQTRSFRHDELGALVFDHHRLSLPDHPGWTVVLYTPEPGTPTAARFRTLL